MKVKKHFGQHFLRSDDFIKKIVESSKEINNQNILEIGAGTGQLTKEILSHNPARLCSVEIDKELFQYHNNLLSTHKNYELILSNALQIKEDEILPPLIKVIANLPYNISTELLCKWLDNINIFGDMVLMFQKEVAERISAVHGSKKYGKLSVITQLLCKVEYLFDVPRHLFSPMPKIDSAIIRITPYEKPLFPVKMDSLKELLRILFCHRRKMIHSILREKFYNVEEILKKINIDMKLRPEKLSIKQLCDLTNILL